MKARTIKATWALFMGTVVMAAVMAFPIPALTQDKPADNMQVLREKIKADKKLLVATNMELTESEAKGFWPVYEEYQKDLAAINQRIGKLIESYAADYRTKTLTDERLPANPSEPGRLRANTISLLSVPGPRRR